MSNLTNALQELRAERKQAQLHVEKLDQAISVIESLNGSGTSGNATRPKRIISPASRRKMALAQKARWARVGKEIKPVVVAKTSSSSVKRTMSASARRKIAAAQKARWAKVRAEQKKAA
jgi:phage major head subunit gpT-like protein